MLKKTSLYLLTSITSLLALIAFGEGKNKYEEKQNALDSLTVVQAKDLYTRLIDPTPVSTPLSSVYNLKNYTPLWEEATASEDNEELIVETPLNFLKLPATVISSSGGKHKLVDVDQKTELLIIRKKSNHYLSFALMHIVPNSGSNTNINYKTKDSSFSGYVFFTNLNGGLINSWEYQKGVAVREGYATTTHQASYSFNSSNSKSCQTISTNWYERSTTTSISGQYNDIPGRYINSYVITYCKPDSLSNGNVGKNEWTAFGGK